MLEIILSLDYEVYGTGRGDPRRLMLDPTAALLAILNRHGARVTIMVEAAEMLAFRREPAFRGIAQELQHQLQQALRQGHDLQLHLHPAWFNAVYRQGQWHLDFTEYALPGLATRRILACVQAGKRYLEDLAAPVQPDYRCVAFRAGNWIMQPSADLVACLEQAGFLLDSSVYKGAWGQVGRWTVDYRLAPDEMLSWTVDPADICRSAPRTGLREVPIFSQTVPLIWMLSPKRLRTHWRLLRNSRGCLRTASHGEGTGRSLNGCRWRHPRKFDFCRLGLPQMKHCLEDALRRSESIAGPVPVVAIGHSSEFRDDGSLDRFLEYANGRPAGSLRWATFGDCSLVASRGTEGEPLTCASLRTAPTG